MAEGRQVRRSGMRPVYGRRSNPGPSRRLNIEIISVLMQWHRRLLYGLGVVIFLVLTAKVTTLKHVQVHGVVALAPDHIHRLAEAGLEEQWFGGNTILADTSSLSSYLSQHEAGIKSVQIKRQLPSTLVVTISERRPSLNWKTQGSTYVLDSDGTVIGPSKGPYIHLPTVNDDSNLPVKAGDRAVPTSFVKFASDFAAGLGSTGLGVSAMDIHDTTSELYIKTNQDFILKLDTTRPAGEELSDLSAVLQDLKAAHKSVSQYIDLRVEHKAYYK